MEEILHYLELKNLYYEKFYQTTTRLYDSLHKEMWEEMQLSVDNRERIINILSTYDQKLAQLFMQLKLTEQQANQYRERVKEMLQIKEAWGKKIVELDVEIAAYLDNVKNETIRGLKQALKTDQQLGSFEAVQAKPKIRSEI